MSYYFCIVGTRDNPLYQADLAPKPAGASGAASFFGVSSSGTTTASQQQQASGDGVNATTSTDSSAATTGGVFGFGNALGAITSGLGASTLSSSSSASARDVARNAGAQTANVSGDGKGLGFGRYNDKHVLQMIAHSSLDVVEDKQFTSNLMYLKAVDRINEWTTSAFIAPGNIKLLILHEHKHDDGIRNFFYDVWELLVKVMMNPFHDLNDPIRSPAFDARVRASARKHL